MNIFKGKDLALRTVTYILAVIIFFLCWYIFGYGYAFIGATISKGALVLLGTDLTGNPLRSTLTFIGVFVYIGLFSYLASLNIYLGFFINFITLFILAYNFSSNVKQLIWRPFVLGYLYLLIEPGTFHMLPSRLITLALGGLFVTLTQLIVNRHKSQKNIKVALNTLIDEICVKLTDILAGKEVINTKYKVLATVDKIVNTIYSKRIDPFFITKKDNIALNLTLYIERLNYLIKEINLDLHNNIEMKFVKDLLNLMNKLKKIIHNNDTNHELINLLDNFYDKHSTLAQDDYYLYEILQNIKMLKSAIENSTYYSYKKRDILFNLKLKKQISTVFLVNFRKDSLRLSFGLKVAILLSTSYFLVEYFKIPHGKWIVFTIYAVIEPIYEDSKKRFPKRLKGTLLGILIFAIIYIFIHNILIQGIIFIFMYYIYVIHKDFIVKTMCTTTVSLGLLAILIDNPYEGIIYRLSFVIIGIGIAYLGNKFIFPYDNKKATTKIIHLYQTLSIEILEYALNNPMNDYYFKILGEKLFLSKLYESKLIAKQNDLINSFVYNQRILNNTIYFLIFSIKETNNQKIILKELNEYLKNSDILKAENYESEVELIKDIKTKIEQVFHTLNTNSEKLAFINLYRILIRIEESKILSIQISNL